VSVSVFILLAVGALFAALLSGVAGVGGGLIYLPFLAEGIGLRKAIPVLACLLLVGNLSRIYFSRHELRWDIAGRFLIGTIPGAFVGALLYTILSATVIARAVGIFLLIYVVLAVARIQWPRRADLRQLPYVGGVAGLVSAIIGGSGPVIAPFCLRFGLVKGAFLSTDAIVAASMHLVKIAVYGQARLLTLEDLPYILPLAVLMILGTWIATLVLTRINENIFRIIVTFLLAVIGLRFILAG
jgi:uncharacterized membrane protein YfcA